MVDEQKSLHSQITRLKDYITQLRLMIDNDSVRTGVEWISRPKKASRPTLDYRICFLTTLTWICAAVPVVFAAVLAIVRIVNWSSRFAPPPRLKSLVA